MILVLILTAINFGLIIYFYLRDVNKFILLILFDLIFLKFILMKMNFYYAPTFYNTVNAALLICLFWGIVYKRSSDTNVLEHTLLFLFYLSFVFLYVVVLDLFRNVNPRGHLDLIKHHFWGILLFILILSKKKKLNIQFLDNVILYIVLIQSIIGLGQYFSTAFAGFFRISHYAWRGDLTTVLSGDTWLINNIVIGTLLRMANFGNLMVFLLAYLLMKILSKKEGYLNRTLFWIAFSLGSFAILLTGIRTSFISLVFAFSLSLFLFKRKYFWLVAPMGLLLFVFYFDIFVALGEESIRQRVQAENPLMRLAGFFYLFSSRFNVNRITLKRSVALFDEFLSKPFFGVGTYFRYAYYGISSITDAYLLFHAVEFGLVGLLILLSPYLFFVYRSKMLSGQLYKFFVVLLATLLLQTVTDNGLFWLVTNMTFWLLFAGNFGDYKNREERFIE